MNYRISLVLVIYVLYLAWVFIDLFLYIFTAEIRIAFLTLLPF